MSLFKFLSHSLFLVIDVLSRFTLAKSAFKLVIFKLLFFFFGILIFFSACTNELDVTPKDDDEFLSEDFYASKDSYRSALAGIYGNLSLTGTGGPTSSNLQGIDAGTSQYGRGW